MLLEGDFTVCLIFMVLCSSTSANAGVASLLELDVQCSLGCVRIGL